MTNLPRHQDANNAVVPTAQRPSRRRTQWRYAAAAAVAVLLILMVVLHLAGVLGPGGR
jgi:ferric-dicitrate binding protein FerR (iron transport regulator)